MARISPDHRNMSTTHARGQPFARQDHPVRGTNRGLATMYGLVAILLDCVFFLLFFFTGHKGVFVSSDN